MAEAAREEAREEANGESGTNPARQSFAKEIERPQAHK